MTDNHHRRGAGLILLPIENPAQQWLNSQGGKHIRRHLGAAQLRWLAASGQSEIVPVVDAKVFENGLLHLPVSEVRIRDWSVLAGGPIQSTLGEPYQAFG